MNILKEHRGLFSVFFNLPRYTIFVGAVWCLLCSEQTDDVFFLNLLFSNVLISKVISINIEFTETQENNIFIKINKDSLLFNYLKRFLSVM